MPAWLIYALLSAFFAALVSILAKIGLIDVDSNLATGLSWLFTSRPFSLGEVNKIVPIDRFSLVLATLLAVIFLRERVAPAGWLGIAFIFAGTLVVSLAK